jgi:hypothetical protein
MNKQYTYIAFLLAGIFSFTISSQAIHFLWHTSRMHTECYHDDQNHGHAHSHKTSDHYVENSLKFDNPHEHCFICEFEFSIVEEPGLFIVETVIPRQDINFINKDYSLSKTLTFHAKSPRAPPGFIS